MHMCLVLCVCFVIVVCPLSFDHCTICPSSIYGFWLPYGIFKLFFYYIIDCMIYLENICRIISHVSLI